MTAASVKNFEKNITTQQVQNTETISNPSLGGFQTVLNSQSVDQKLTLPVEKTNKVAIALVDDAVIWSIIGLAVVAMGVKKAWDDLPQSTRDNVFGIVKEAAQQGVDTAKATAEDIIKQLKRQMEGRKPPKAPPTDGKNDKAQCKLDVEVYALQDGSYERTTVKASVHATPSISSGRVVETSITSSYGGIRTLNEFQINNAGPNFLFDTFYATQHPSFTITGHCEFERDDMNATLKKRKVDLGKYNLNTIPGGAQIQYK
jgi:hypothetical protein